MYICKEFYDILKNKGIKMQIETIVAVIMGVGDLNNSPNRYF